MEYQVNIDCHKLKNMSDQIHADYVVTGAFSYSGKYVTNKLLTAGKTVKTLTGHPKKEHSFGKSVQRGEPLSVWRVGRAPRGLRPSHLLF